MRIPSGPVLVLVVVVILTVLVILVVLVVLVEIEDPIWAVTGIGCKRQPVGSMGGTGSGIDLLPPVHCSVRAGLVMCPSVHLLQKQYMYFRAFHLM